MSWTLALIPELSGKHALVTGGTGGLGHHVALELARAGARVTLTGRNEHALKETTDQIQQEVKGAALETVHVDLADLASIRYAAESVLAHGDPVDILVNNAGVMAPPYRRTSDGFELQFGTNHLGHFALTGALLPLLGSARVVTVTSLMHRGAKRVPLTDPRMHDGYRRWQAYCESKLANVQFALELNRRARAAGLDLTSVAAHPGYTATRLQSSGLQMGGAHLSGYALSAVTRVVGQSAAAGALPILYAATQQGLPGGALAGPSRLMELRGSPRIVEMSRAAQDPVAAAGLWQLSERATGITFLS
ncbi:MAG: oxidoreductase [Nocardioidaceae bacterium]